MNTIALNFPRMRAHPHPSELSFMLSVPMCVSNVCLCVCVCVCVQDFGLSQSVGPVNIGVLASGGGDDGGLGLMIGQGSMAKVVESEVKVRHGTVCVCVCVCVTLSGLKHAHTHRAHTATRTRMQPHRAAHGAACYQGIMKHVCVRVCVLYTPGCTAYLSHAHTTARRRDTCKRVIAARVACTGSTGSGAHSCKHRGAIHTWLSVCVCVCVCVLSQDLVESALCCALEVIAVNHSIHEGLSRVLVKTERMESEELTEWLQHVKVCVHTHAHMHTHTHTHTNTHTHTHTHTQRERER